MLATPQPASKMTGGPGNVPTDLRKPAHGPSRTLKSGPRRAPGASPSTLRATLGSPEELPGAATPRICKRLQREHQLRPPSQSTLYPVRHPAPPVDSTMFRRSLIEVIACPFSQASPRAGPGGRRIRKGCALCRRPREKKQRGVRVRILIKWEFKLQIIHTCHSY